MVAPLGTPVDVLDATPGAAMARKLLRSVFMKGLALVICEAVEAGRAAGDAPWTRAELTRATERSLRRYAEKSAPVPGQFLVREPTG